MALFNTPSLLGEIWRKQEFPQDGGGFAGLVGGLTGGFAAGREYKNTPKGERSFVGAMQEAASRGAENSAEISQPLHPIQRKVASQTLAMNTFKLQEAITNRDIAVKEREGIAEMNRVLSEGQGPNADPDATIRALYDVGSRYAIPPEKFDTAIQRATMMKQHRDMATRFGGGAPAVGGNQTVTTKYKDPYSGVEYTVSDKPETSTATVKDLEKANEYDSIAERLEADGFRDVASKYRRDAGLLRSRVEGGPSSVAGHLKRQESEAMKLVAELEARVKSGQNTPYLKGGMLTSPTKELNAAKAVLSEIRRQMTTVPGGAAAASPIDEEDPAGLFKDEAGVE